MFFETYARLVSDFPFGCDQLFGHPLTPEQSVWLSVDSDAYPSLLFSAQQSEIRSDIELRSLSARFSRDCVIDTLGGPSASGTFTVVSLNENDPDIVRMLLRLLEEAFCPRPKPYTNGEIASRILHISSLFKKISDSSGDIIGLWGELCLISRAGDKGRAVQCWCGDKMAKHDFLADSFALEVKTTVGTRRKHRFSLGQLRPINDFRVYVASLVLVELNSGETASELMDEISTRINDDELRAEFLALCMLKGGQDLYRNSMRLAELPDGTSLILLDSLTIPVPEVSPHSPIENVRFDVDLTNLAPLSHGDVEALLKFGRN